MKGTILCNFQFLSDYRVIVKEGDRTLYEGGAGFFETAVDTFWRNWTGFSHTVTLNSPKGEEILLEKKWPAPGVKYGFQLTRNHEVYTVREGDDFKIPDLLIEGQGKLYRIEGEVKDLNFTVKEGEEIFCRIRGERTEEGKLYRVEGKDDLIAIGATLVLDNLYHHY